MSITAIPADHVAEAIDSLRAAQRTWETQPVRERLRDMTALRHLLATECDALCDATDRLLFVSHLFAIIRAQRAIDSLVAKAEPVALLIK